MVSWSNHAPERTIKVIPPVRILWALPLLVVALIIAAACDAGDGTAPDQAAPASHGDGYALYPKLPAVTGHIDRVEAQADNGRYFRLLIITDADGRQWSFGSNGWAGVSAGHLKDHQIHGTTVTVWYETGADGKLLARFVGD